MTMSSCGIIIIGLHDTGRMKGNVSYANSLLNGRRALGEIPLRRAGEEAIAEDEPEFAHVLRAYLICYHLFSTK